MRNKARFAVVYRYTEEQMRRKCFHTVRAEWYSGETRPSSTSNQNIQWPS